MVIAASVSPLSRKAADVDTSESHKGTYMNYNFQIQKTKQGTDVQICISQSVPCQNTHLRQRCVGFFFVHSGF